MSKIIQLFCIVAIASGCAATTHGAVPSQLGHPTTGDRVVEMGGTPGPVELTRVTAANWEVPLSGMLNLDHPAAEAAGIVDVDEPIVIQFFVLRHPEHGTYLIDTGVAASFRSKETAPVSWLIQQALNFDTLHVEKDTGQWLAENDNRLDGVFLTHVHLDHIMGIPDIPSRVPVYTGPGEASASRFEHMFTQGSTNDMLENAGSLREWPFERDTSGRFAGVVDVFGDESVFALHVPGHTPGSTAFLVRTTTGPELVVGDASHTKWGWEHRVEPGTYSMDRPRSVTSLGQLKTLERDLPGMLVHPGHQHLDGQGHGASSAELAGTLVEAR